MRIGYASYSVDDENLEIQRNILKRAGCSDIIEDREPGAGANRPGLKHFLDILGPDDDAVVWRLDRLGRSYKELIENINLLEIRKVNLVSKEEGIDTTNSDGQTFFKVFVALGKFEKNRLVERTKPGLSAAKARGKKGGRKEKLTKEQKKTLFNMYDSNEYIIKDICQSLNISRPTLYSYLGKRQKSSKPELKLETDQPIKRKDNVIELPVSKIRNVDKPTAVSSSTQIYQFKIWLESIHPLIWRRFQVGNKRTLQDLHKIIQVLFNWKDYHLHKFYVCKTGRYKWEDDPEDEDQTLESYKLEPDDLIFYDYDYGDQWMHTLKLEKILKVNPKNSYPVCRTGAKAAPPEDCGGPMEYIDILEAIKRRQKKAKGKLRWHTVFDGFLGIPIFEEDDYRLDWLAANYPGFDPSEFDKESINKQFDRLVTELILS